MCIVQERLCSGWRARLVSHFVSAILARSSLNVATIGSSDVGSELLVSLARVAGNVEFYWLSLPERTEALREDSSLVHKHIVPTVIRRDESKPLYRVEEFHFAGDLHVQVCLEHTSVLRRKSKQSENCWDSLHHSNYNHNISGYLPTLAAGRNAAANPIARRVKINWNCIAELSLLCKKMFFEADPHSLSHHHVVEPFFFVCFVCALVTHCLLFYCTLIWYNMDKVRLTNPKIPNPNNCITVIRCTRDRCTLPVSSKMQQERYQYEQLPI